MQKHKFQFVTMFVSKPLSVGLHLMMKLLDQILKLIINNNNKLLRRRLGLSVEDSHGNGDGHGEIATECTYQYS